MQIRAGYRITFDSEVTTPINLMVRVHPDRRADLVVSDDMVMSRPCPVSSHIDGFGNEIIRVLAPPGPVTFSTSFVIEDRVGIDPQHPTAGQIWVEDLPNEALPFLLGSRYCETDQMNELAWSLFGGIEPGWPRVQAIVDYAHRRIAFGYQHAATTRTALQGHEDQRGVCRDYAHLAVTLCRCMNIPARYCTGYLGDIGLEPGEAPIDFTAWFEAYLEGGWHTFDARHHKPRQGRILIARGRDATDVAISTTFGATWLTDFQVFTEEVVEA
jgi:transglutaminase-like putative cysteine protease